ncbi:MAG: hypothetical protein V4613_07965 [Bacteroidota bacterium]
MKKYLCFIIGLFVSSAQAQFNIGLHYNKAYISSAGDITTALPFVNGLRLDIGDREPNGNHIGISLGAQWINHQSNGTILLYKYNNAARYNTAYKDYLSHDTSNWRLPKKTFGYSNSYRMYSIAFNRMWIHKASFLKPTKHYQGLNLGVCAFFEGKTVNDSEAEKGPYDSHGTVGFQLGYRYMNETRLYQKLFITSGLQLNAVVSRQTVVLSGLIEIGVRRYWQMID